MLQKIRKYREWFVVILMIITGVLGCLNNVLMTPVLMLVSFVLGIIICILLKE